MTKKELIEETRDELVNFLIDEAYLKKFTQSKMEKLKKYYWMMLANLIVDIECEVSDGKSQLQ